MSMLFRNDTLVLGAPKGPRLGDSGDTAPGISPSPPVAHLKLAPDTFQEEYVRQRCWRLEIREAT